jgi:threonine dehydrogenase-like Zn-dependent dehydrogenase
VLGLREHPGVFTEFVTLPLENLHRVPSGIPDEVAVFTEPLAAALEIQQQVEIRPSDHVLLVGSGRLGLLIAMTIALTGCDFLVTARRKRARGLLASYHIPTILPEEIPQHRMDVVIDATGSPQGFNLARGAVRPGGIIILKSTYTGSIGINMSEVVVDEVTLIGSRCGPFAPALRLFESGRIDPTLLIDATYPLREGLAAFEYAAKPGALKMLLRP